ncbi:MULTISPECIES: pyridoxamine 5'-phosphate oxidase family protein [unclassified Mycobacterium]|uniref:pyridoxamine 5'-phosphate oxidase family protein n=1 Tax=unclassified Mycobacterium TaxID=2642494 RepID=UPI000991E726|nr:MULTISPECIES: pyridoxamine 5'-phosphate oxidase family protein [unclassified Mycobacterium]
MGLSLEERQAFLAEPHVAAISVSAGADRAPLTVPIWYFYTPGGDLWVPTGKGSRKHQLIEAAGRLTLMVDREQPTVRYVSVEGPVTKVVPLEHDQHRQVAARYIPEELLDGYLTYSEGYGEQIAVYVSPEHWLSADLGGPENWG